MKNHKTVMCKVVIVLLFCISMIIVGVQGVTANTLSVAEEKQAADTVAKGGYQVIMTRTPIFGLGIADKYRTPMIMDALLDLVKHPERVEDDEELIAWRELFTMATDSHDPRMVPYICEHAGDKKVILALANRMPKAAYDYALNKSTFHSMLIQDLLDGSGLLTEEQQKKIREVVLERIVGNTSSEVPWILRILGHFAAKNDKEAVEILKKYADEYGGTDFGDAAMAGLAMGAHGNSSLADYLLWLYNNPKRPGARGEAIRNLAIAAGYSHRTDLFAIVELTAKDSGDKSFSSDAIIGLRDAVLQAKSQEAEAILKKLADSGIQMAKDEVQFINFKRRQDKSVR